MSVQLNKLSNKCGYIKFDGTEIIPTIFDEVEQFNKFGLVVVNENHKIVAFHLVIVVRTWFMTKTGIL